MFRRKTSKMPLSHGSRVRRTATTYNGNQGSDTVNLTREFAGGLPRLQSAPADQIRMIQPLEYSWSFVLAVESSRVVVTPVVVCRPKSVLIPHDSSDLPEQGLQTSPVQSSVARVNQLERYSDPAVTAVRVLASAVHAPRIAKIDGHDSSRWVSHK